MAPSSSFVVGAVDDVGEVGVELEGISTVAPLSVKVLRIRAALSHSRFISVGQKDSIPSFPVKSKDSDTSRRRVKIQSRQKTRLRRRTCSFTYQLVC